VRLSFYAAAALALAAISSPDTIRSVLAASAGALVEATPFLFAAVALSRLSTRYDCVAAYAGCGCAPGPAARSLPAAAATWLLFGPFVAIGRWLIAMLVARALRRRHRADAAAHLHAELRAVLPCAILAGMAMQVFAAFDPARLSPVWSAFAGTVLAFFAAPCALGAITLAATLRAHAPPAAAAFLCIAGIADLRALTPARSTAADEDAFAYVLLAAALSVVAWNHGDGLVNPAFVPALWCCAIAAACGIVAHRSRRSENARIAPALMLAGALMTSPAPQYHATETTMTELFPGERLTFTGTLARNGNASAVVRYAITCCRADAAPVAVRLTANPRYPAGTWLRVEGSIENVAGNLRLAPRRIERVAAPADPFIYF